MTELVSFPKPLVFGEALITAHTLDRTGTPMQSSITFAKNCPNAPHPSCRPHQSPPAAARSVSSPKTSAREAAL